MLLTNTNRSFIISTGTVIIIPPVVVIKTFIPIITVLGNKIEESVFGLILALIIIKTSSSLLKTRTNIISLTVVNALVKSKEIVIVVKTVIKKKTVNQIITITIIITVIRITVIIIINVKAVIITILQT